MKPSQKAEIFFANGAPRRPKDKTRPGNRMKKYYLSLLSAQNIKGRGREVFFYYFMSFIQQLNLLREMSLRCFITNDTH